MFSKTCEYAIRAIIYLCSVKNTQNAVKINEIAKAIEAPEYYTSKILQKLAKSNLIGSKKGPSGGFYIDENFAKIKLIDIVLLLDGDKIFKGCSLGLKECSEVNPCPLHNDFAKVRKSIKSMLEKTTIDSLSNKILAENSVFKLH